MTSLAMLDVYQEVLGLKFSPTANPHVWHPEVKMYDVRDAETRSLNSSAHPYITKINSEFIGHFYLDLHPREGKYGHAAEFDLQKGADSK